MSKSSLKKSKDEAGVSLPCYVAVYGTLKSGHGNHHLLEDPGVEFVGEAETVDNLPLVVCGLPFLYNVPGTGHHVSVEVYKISSAAVMEKLDRLEGHPVFYLRDKTKVKLLEGRVLEVWVYFHTAKFDCGETLHKSFLRRIYRG